MSSLFKPLWGKPQPPQQIESLEKSFKFKTRFAMVGTIGSGKTTVSTLLVLTSQTLSHLLPYFSCLTLEGSTNIVDYVSKMRIGKFPPKTDASKAIRHEAGLLLRYEGKFGSAKQINLPICDLAGEKLQSMIHSVQKRLEDPTSQEFLNMNQNLLNYVHGCEGYILIAPASRAMIFQDGVQLEKETEDEKESGISEDPDANLYKFLQAIRIQKESSRGKAIRALAVIITKWDILQPYAMNMGYDISDPESIQSFMQEVFPQTTSFIKFEQKRNPAMQVRFFPSYVKIRKNAEGKPEKWPDGHDKIEMEDNQRIPKYWAESYKDLIQFLGYYAT